MIWIIIAIIIAVILVGYFVLQTDDKPSPTPAPTPAPAPTPTPTPPPKPDPNQKYFGYYWGYPEAYPENFQDYCNCSVITVQLYDMNEVLEKHITILNGLKKLGVKGIVDVEFIFASFHGKKGQWEKDDMFAEWLWKVRWDSYWKGILPHLENILCFYFDEPFQDEVDTMGYVRNSLDTVKKDYDIHILTVHTPSQIVGIKWGVYNIPDAVDWIGFDDYSCFDNATVCGLFIGYGPPNYRGYDISIPEKAKLLADTYPDKKIMFIPGGVSRPNFYDFTEEELIVRNYKFLELCQNTPNSVGMIVYSYRSTHQESAVDRKPKLEAQLRNIGMCLTGKDPSKCSDLITCLPNWVDDPNKNHCESDSTCCSGKCDLVTANCNLFKTCVGHCVPK